MKSVKVATRKLEVNEAQAKAFKTIHQGELADTPQLGLRFINKLNTHVGKQPMKRRARTSDKSLCMVMLDEKVIGVWHFEFNGGNFLATLREKGSEGMTLVSRLRYYLDDKTGPDSIDAKYWLLRDLQVNVDAAEVVRSVRDAITEIAREENARLHEVLMDETGLEGLRSRVQKLMRPSYFPFEAYPRSVQRCCARALAKSSGVRIPAADKAERLAVKLAR